MTRLRHSADGFRRFMQMSQAQLFAFVEGYTDRYFYDRVCEAECVPQEISYFVCTADELPGDAGGKEALIILFKNLRRNRSLVDVFKGTSHLSVFFLDKDVDDYRRKRLRSPHVVYTRYYQVENYWYAHGKLDVAFAQAASLDVASVQRALGSAEAWRQMAARTWQDWVRLCFLAHVNQIRCGATYNTGSKVNANRIGKLDSTAYIAFVSKMERASALDAPTFSQLRLHAATIVDRLYDGNRHDVVFRGKWYGQFAAALVKQAAGKRRLSTKAIGERITTALIASLDFNSSWASDFRVPLRKLISAVGSRSQTF